MHREIGTQSRPAKLDCSRRQQKIGLNMALTWRGDPYEPYHPERVLLRAGMWVAIFLFAVCLAINVVSIFGYDLTQLFHSPWSSMEGSDPEVAFVVPIGFAFLILLVPILLRQWLWGRRLTPISLRTASLWFKIAGPALWLYLVAIMIYMMVTFHFGGPVIHNGVGMIWFKGDHRYELVTPEVYHRAVAVVTLYISACGMVAFIGMAAIYHRWLREVSEPTGWSRPAGDEL